MVHLLGDSGHDPRPVLVPPSSNQVREEVGNAHDREQQIEQIQMVPVNVVPCKPTTTPGHALCCPVHNLDQYAAEEVPQRHGAPQEAGGERLEPLRRLRVEQLEEPDVREHVGDPKDEELEGEPEHADGQRLSDRYRI